MSKPAFTHGSLRIGVDPTTIWSNTTFIGRAQTPWLPHAEQVANARLWAAAPDLYAACRAVLLWFRIHGNPGVGEDEKLVMLVRAALAKADGKLSPQADLSDAAE